ncbi:hypothetical protein MHF_0528 [Mycoplasma haemofelis Ohio2]|uniref:Uncharacterized protein n=1 Tax=Mycoplasma haemofelis (strain Ohio2) TaxID=859194 RepID=F6FHV2_MYCHI|nr:hypothetical protein MHF_0528 [Mycoplasma haemofelis Ohio2]
MQNLEQQRWLQVERDLPDERLVPRNQKPEKEIVSKYLTRIGRTPASDADWESLKDFYSKESDSHPISGIPKANITPKSIKDWCSSELSKTTEDQAEAHLLLIESWCSKPQKLSERLSAIGKVKLDTTGSEDTWSKYKEEYKTSSTGKTIQKKSSSGDKWEDFESSTVNEQVLKDWCKGHEGSHFKHRKDVLFEKYVRWCSK